MPPKSDKKQCNPEKHAKLTELWANNLPLKYGDHACIERDKNVLFAQQLFILSCELEMRRVWKLFFDQLFDAFFVMAVNALKTKNDVNEAVKAGKGKQHAKEYATMSNSDLRHTVASHFDNVVANLNNVEEFNSIFSIIWKGISYLMNGLPI
jgi:hypothetical protein